MSSTTTTDQKFRDSKATLPEPHFDEEATVLSARPVVPLEEVGSLKAATLITRPWALCLGLAGALLVGVFATVIYYSRSNGDASNVLETVEIESGTEGISDESARGVSGPAPSQAKTEIEKPVTKSTTAPVKPSNRAASDPGDNPRPRLVGVIRETKRNNHIEEDRRAARRQTRRERRGTEREGRDGKSSDELLRIREIFEGSPRP